MASIQKSATLCKRIYLTNIVTNNDDLNITPMLIGAHGVGKSQILKSVATDMGGTCFTIECSSTGEGEITGLPFAAKATDGSTEVRYVKYYQVNKIWQLEKYYFEKAKTTGFLNGTIKVRVDEEGNQYLIVNGKETLERTPEDIIRDGQENIYKFGKSLSSDLKLKLLEDGEIKPIVLFFDELNRADQQVMKEMMNIILNRTVNGYTFPWWVNLCAAQNPCSQNSTYATNELDDAQLDRFLKIKVDAKIDEWVDYALAKGLNTDVIEALAIAEGIFIHRESGQEDMSEMSPSPRSWEMVSNIYSHIHELNETKYFDSEERKAVNDDLRILVRGKVGETAARTLLENINRKENNIKPTEILTGKAVTISKEILTKFNAQKTITKKIISDNVANYVCSNYELFDKTKVGTDAKKKEVHMNYTSQLKEFINQLDVATQILFVKKILAHPQQEKVYKAVASCFSREILAHLVESKSALSDALKD